MHIVGQLSEWIDGVGCADDLSQAMRDICEALGFQYFALTHHAWAMSGRTLLSDRLSTVAQFTPIAIL